jgi:hypothetical protein
MSRTGKIARLPHGIRDQLNHRLHDGERGVSLLKWLNGLPEVRQTLAARSDSLPLNETNLSRWKLGGYREWLLHQQALDYVRGLTGDAAELEQAAEQQFTEKLALWLAARYAAALIKSESDPEGPAGEELQSLRSLARDVMELRRGDLSAGRLKIERERLDLQKASTAKEQEEAFWARALTPEVSEKILHRHRLSDDNLQKARLALFGSLPEDPPNTAEESVTTSPPPTVADAVSSEAPNPPDTPSNGK